MRSRLVAMVMAGFLTLGVVSSTLAISFIESPTAYCTKIKGNNCVINWGYMSVSAAPNYIIDLWVVLEDKVVLYARGFFQQSLYIGNEFIRNGIPVKCGPATSPAPLPSPGPLVLGNSYAYTVRARDSAGLASANYGTVQCPAK